MTASGNRGRATLSTRVTQLVTVLVATVAMYIPAASAKYDEIVTAPTGVAYVSGGAGTESIDRLRSLERQFTLKLVFALETGEYLAGVGVIVTDSADRVQLATVSDGPWLLARLPAGAYQISVSHGGSVKNRRIVLGVNTLRTVDFRWSAD